MVPIALEMGLEDARAVQEEPSLRALAEAYFDLSIGEAVDPD